VPHRRKSAPGDANGQEEDGKEDGGKEEEEEG
jgi:hypothetical protein